MRLNAPNHCLKPPLCMSQVCWMWTLRARLSECGSPVRRSTTNSSLISLLRSQSRGSLDRRTRKASHTDRPCGWLKTRTTMSSSKVSPAPLNIPEHSGAFLCLLYTVHVYVCKHTNMCTWESCVEVEPFYSSPVYWSSLYIHTHM